MEFKKVKYVDDKFFLNKDQYFIFEKDRVKKNLAEIAFPIIMMDTEFFNKSHDVAKLKPPLYDKDNPNLIYTLSFSIANSYQELLKRDNEKSISTYKVNKRFKEKNFDFKKAMDKMLTEFFHVAIKRKVKTLVFAGKSNDERILNSWINQHQAILNNKVSRLFTKSKSDQKIKINAVDIYPVLEQGVSFHDELHLEKQVNLKKGVRGEQTIQIPSLKRFFDFVNLFPNVNGLKEEHDIYDLCIDVLKLFTNQNLSIDKHKKYQKSFVRAWKHCRNDVVKLVYLILFLYCFAKLSDRQNPFIKTEEKKSS